MIVRRLAEGHLAEAYAWFEAQSLGLGVDFLNRFEALLPAIARFPKATPSCLWITAGRCCRDFLSEFFM